LDQASGYSYVLSMIVSENRSHAFPKSCCRSYQMFKVRVIPCLDVKDGRVVKGVNFVDLRDAGDPVEAAIAYDAAGADELCFLDITATHENRGTMLEVVRRTAEACFMPLTVGGGVRTVDDIRVLLRSGADKVSINSAAVSRREFVKEAAEKFGDQCIVVAIDAKRVKRGGGERWEIFTHGGRNSTGIDAIEYAQEVVSLGAGEILLTSMDRDGTRQGFDIALTRAIADAVTVPVIPHNGDDLVAPRREGPDHGSPDETGGPRDQHPHGLILPHVTATMRWAILSNAAIPRSCAAALLWFPPFARASSPAPTSLRVCTAIPAPCDVTNRTLPSSCGITPDRQSKRSGFPAARASQMVSVPGLDATISWQTMAAVALGAKGLTSTWHGERAAASRKLASSRPRRSASTVM